MDKKRQDEADFRAKVTANPEWKAAYSSAWDAIADAEKKMAPRAREPLYRALDSQLLSLASNLVEYVAEIRKPDGDRLPGYHDAQLDSLKYRMFSPAPIYPAMEIARLGGSLDLALAELGSGDALLRAVLNGRAPQQAAADLVNGTKLADRRSATSWSMADRRPWRPPPIP